MYKEAKETAGYPSIDKPWLKYYDLFLSEITGTESKPCAEPYPLSDYDAATRKILKDIDDNRNHSWIREIWLRNRSRLHYSAIKYRGQEFTYREFFAQSYRYAMALKANGYQKGQEMVCAIENTPEFPFIMGAVSILAGKVNLVSAEMDADYLAETVERADFPFIFVSDMSFAKFAPVMKLLQKERRLVLTPLEHSLKSGNPYREITDQYYKPDEEKLAQVIRETESVTSIDAFLAKGESIDGAVMEESGLNDEYTVTYTSGSTGWGRPKALIHHVRSYITMGRYHDAKVSGIPTMEKRTTLCIVKTMSDTDFMTNISDTFMQGGVVALEPINDKEYFLTAMLLNQPHYAVASRSYWLYAMKGQTSSPDFQNISFPNLLAPTAIGEPLSVGEERALNKWLRAMKAGTGVIKLPFSVISMCVGGGDSEHGGIFILLFRSLQNKRPSHWGIKEPIGMRTYGMVKVKALHKDGTYCAPMEAGILVANAPCMMEGYVNNPEADRAFFIKDAYGITWGNLNTYGYIDKANHIYVKGRVSDADFEIPNYAIQDVISQDVKHIMSCEVVNFEADGKNICVAHIEPQIGIAFEKEKVLQRAAANCRKAFGAELLDSLYFRIHTSEESFLLLHTGKRNNIALVQEGISDQCVCAKAF